MRTIYRNHSRVAISELFATLITLVLTVITGAAVFSYVNAQASISAQSYGQIVGTYVEQLREKFVITNVAFNYPSTGQVRIWFYNYGDIDTKIMQLYIGTSTSSLVNVTSSISPLNLPRGTIATITITYTVTTGQPYYLKAVAQRSNSQIYLQTA